MGCLHLRQQSFLACHCERFEPHCLEHLMVNKIQLPEVLKECDQAHYKLARVSDALLAIVPALP
eukprot:2171869-Prorocentrum_lima.AAC.1